MNLSQARLEIAEALGIAGFEKVYTYVPERPQPKCAIIEPDNDFIMVYEDQYDADYSSKWKVLILVPYATNQKETENLDSYLDALIPSLWENTEATKLRVDRPFIQDVNGANYLATTINIEIDLQGGN